jgi:hypothetical protein
VHDATAAAADAARLERLGLCGDALADVMRAAASMRNVPDVPHLPPRAHSPRTTARRDRVAAAAAAAHALRIVDDVRDRVDSPDALLVKRAIAALAKVVRARDASGHCVRDMSCAVADAASQLALQLRRSRMWQHAFASQPPPLLLLPNARLLVHTHLVAAADADADAAVNVNADGGNVNVDAGSTNANGSSNNVVHELHEDDDPRGASMAAASMASRHSDGGRALRGIDGEGALRMPRFIVRLSHKLDQICSVLFAQRPSGEYHSATSNVWRLFCDAVHTSDLFGHATDDTLQKANTSGGVCNCNCNCNYNYNCCCRC